MPIETGKGKIVAAEEGVSQRVIVLLTMMANLDMQKRLLNSLGCLMLMIFLTSCGDNSLVEVKPEADCWKFSQRLEIDIDHPGGKLGLPVRLSLTSDYPFSNMYLQARLSSNDGLDTSWTTSYTFVDRLGKWEVEAQSGNYKISHPILADAEFPAGSYSLTLGHAMRPERICGVESVAILNKKKN